MCQKIIYNLKSFLEVKRLIKQNNTPLRSAYEQLNYVKKELYARFRIAVSVRRLGYKGLLGRYRVLSKSLLS